MGFFGYFKKGIELAMLKGDAADEVASDPESFVPALVIYMLPSVLVAVLLVVVIQMFAGAGMAGMAGPGGLPPQAAIFIPLISKISYGLIILLPLAALLGTLFYVGILHLVAKLFKGEGTFLDFYQTVGIGSLVSWGGILPYIGILFSLWTVVVTVVVTSRVHKLSTGKSVAVVLLPLVVLFAIGIALAIGFAAMMMGSMPTHH